MDSRAQDQELGPTGLVVLRHVGSPWTRDRTCVSCFDGRILYRCITREVLSFSFFLSGLIFAGFQIVFWKSEKQVPPGSIEVEPGIRREVDS